MMSAASGLPPGKQRIANYRLPRPALRYGDEHKHKGVIIEKSGEDNNASKKQRVMYLYSPTVKKADGLVVCSQDWRDYEIGDWLEFSVMGTEQRYFSSKRIGTFLPTQVDNGIVKVLVHFMKLPDTISNRLHAGKEKLWSPEMGPVYSVFNSGMANGVRAPISGGKRGGFAFAPPIVEEVKLKEDTMYEGWIQWAMTTVNFGYGETDPQGWPYEPNCHWRVVGKERTSDQLKLSWECEAKHYDYFAESEKIELSCQREQEEEQAANQAQRKAEQFEQLNGPRKLPLHESLAQMKMENNSSPIVSFRPHSDRVRRIQADPMTTANCDNWLPDARVVKEIQGHYGSSQAYQYIAPKIGYNPQSDPNWQLEKATQPSEQQSGLSAAAFGTSSLKPRSPPNYSFNSMAGGDRAPVPRQAPPPSFGSSNFNEPRVYANNPMPATHERFSQSQAPQPNFSAPPTVTTLHQIPNPFNATAPRAPAVQTTTQFVEGVRATQDQEPPRRQVFGTSFGVPQVTKVKKEKPTTASSPKSDAPKNSPSFFSQWQKPFGTSFATSPRPHPPKDGNQ